MGGDCEPTGSQGGCKGAAITGRIFCAGSYFRLWKFGLVLAQDRPDWACGVPVWAGSGRFWLSRRASEGVCQTDSRHYVIIVCNKEIFVLYDTDCNKG